MISLILLFFISLGILFKLKRFFYSNKFCDSKRKLNGKTVIVTGGNSGIGFETALDLAKRGARVIIASENYDDCLRAAAEIVKKTSNKNIVGKFLDLSDFNSVRIFAEDILKTEKELNILINNAGTIRNMKKITKNGLPEVLQVNYFGHFLLTYLLIDLLKKSPLSKIIFVSSSAHRVGVINFDDIKILPKFLPSFFYYCNSKLLILYATWALAEKLKKFQISVNCVHPGAVKSNIFLSSTDFVTTLVKDLLFYYLYPCVLNPYEGAQTTIHCAVCEKSDNITGMYFKNCRAVPSIIKKDQEKIKKVWEQSIFYVNLDKNEIKI